VDAVGVWIQQDSDHPSKKIRTTPYPMCSLLTVVSNGSEVIQHRRAIQWKQLVCVEGWSAIAWWAGLRFDDLLSAYPPMSQAKWARLESSVNLGRWGNPDPYFVSLDLSTARHPQTLLATHLNGKPLTVEHGAPLRLLVPVKLGLKNTKAITRITYTGNEPADYWAERGYSRYDGI
jgi:DMSO/TMAO reductase YedYZ molybdopterin-dependent catalytic subunit